MSKFIFTYIDDEFQDEHSRVITHEVLNAEEWHNVLPHFMDFLKGVGFIFDKYAELEIVNNEEVPEISLENDLGNMFGRGDSGPTW